MRIYTSQYCEYIPVNTENIYRNNPCSMNRVSIKNLLTCVTSIIKQGPNREKQLMLFLPNRGVRIKSRKDTSSCPRLWEIRQEWFSITPWTTQWPRITPHLVRYNLGSSLKQYMNSLIHQTFVILYTSEGQTQIWLVDWFVRSRVFMSLCYC